MFWSKRIRIFTQFVKKIILYKILENNNLHIIYNGDIFLASEPVIKANNRAFCYGDALFESIRAVGAKILFADDHFERLYKGLEVLKIKKDNVLSQEKLTKEIVRLINRDKLFGGVRIRVEIYRDAAGFYTPNGNSAGYLIQCTPLDEINYTLNKKGLSIGVFTDVKKQVNIFSSFKTSNALHNTLAGIYSKEQGFDDCLIVNDKDSIIEGFHSNLFLIKGNNLYTPALDQGCVGGVMRKQILELAPELGLNTSEQITVTEAILLQADEIFLSNAIEGVRWVMAFKNRRYFNKVSKALCDKLNAKVFSV